MAILKLGPILVGVRGTIQGITFSANGSGPYCRQYAAPAQRRTVAQSGVRAWFAELRYRWGMLTPAQVANWDALAASPPEADYNSLGELIYLSGSAWYMRVNIRRFQVGQGRIDAAPPSVAVTPPTGFALQVYDFNMAPGSDWFDYTTGDFAGAYAILHLSPSISSVRNVQTNGYLSIWSGTVPNNGPKIISSEIRAAFGWLSPNQKIFGRLWKQSQQGIRSTAVLATTLVLESP